MNLVLHLAKVDWGDVCLLAEKKEIKEVKYRVTRIFVNDFGCKNKCLSFVAEL